MADNPRIEELRRRVEKDPASIAFAQLAEEHRRAGEFEDAIRVCRAGLDQHPGYLSARVTLGRALLETGQFHDAQTELEYVVRAAPDNLAAIRALAELHQRTEGDETFIRPVVTEALPPAPEQEPLASDFGILASDFGPLTSDLNPLTPDPVLAELEGWLAAIHLDRDARRGVKPRPTASGTAGRQ